MAANLFRTLPPNPAVDNGLDPAGGGDEEVRRILEAAADLQERSSALGTGSARGLTIQELRQVAAEAGIDPHFVDMAATDVDAPMEKSDGSWMGGADKWHFRTTVPGEVGDEEREQIVMALRSLMGAKGVIEEVFGRMEWSMNDGMGPVVIGVSSRDGTTEIDMTADRSGEAGLIHGLGIPSGGIILGAIAAGTLSLSGPVVLPVIGALSVATYGLTRLFWRRRSAELERRYRKAMERASSIVQDSARLPQPDEDAPKLAPPAEDA